MHHHANNQFLHRAHETLPGVSTDGPMEVTGGITGSRLAME